MSRWRIAVVAVLLAGPLLVLAAAGSYFLWWHGWSLWVWWPMMSLMGLGYGLAIYWQSNNRLLRPPEPPEGPHFTERDREAARLVQARAEAGARDHADKLLTADFYLQSAREMANELARHYYPGSTEAIDRLTVPEMLAAVELAAEDLADMTEKYMPGGHLLTVGDFKAARDLAGWYQAGSNAYWGVMAFLDPIQTGLRYAATKAGIDLPMRALQANLLGWFYQAFIMRLGHYLIELGSGRLRVGARKYRELRARHQLSSGGESMAQSQPAPQPAPRVTLTVVGQVKAGKSSVINALLGEERARTGATPLTEGVWKYDSPATASVPAALTLFDTEGYGNEGPRADQVEKTFAAASASDLLLIILHARSPGRKADLEMLRKLEEHFAARPDLKCPPIIAAVTHVDLLSPAMEWSPPYNWRDGSRPKEVSIREAAEFIKKQLEGHLDAVAPVCTAAGKAYGIDDGLLPAMAAQLDEARGVAFLRAVKQEADGGRIQRLFSQVWNAGKLGGTVLWEALGKAVAGKK
jgi:predicted GTPase